MRDDVETREIGRLIDAGHPELAARAFVTRIRHRTYTVLGLATIGLFGGAGALLHWIM